ncbi:MAG: EscU/YscU/HrcU family type III secretion system export apparatus switch protein, partial [Pseudomonadota bacterium]
MTSKDNKQNNKDAQSKYAVALKYEPKLDDAPKVVAKGQGLLAETIVKLAEENDIEIHKDADLSNILYQLEINSVIPVEAYVAIAEIFSFIYKKNSKNTV